MEQMKACRMSRCKRTLITVFVHSNYSSLIFNSKINGFHFSLPPLAFETHITPLFEIDARQYMFIYSSPPHPITRSACFTVLR